jgi:hypothetical protein
MTDTYNLFRRADDRTVFCAVPQDRPVPSFIRAPGWAYYGTSEAAGIVIPGFDAEMAVAATEIAGYYAFISVAWTRRPALSPCLTDGAGTELAPLLPCAA